MKTTVGLLDIAKYTEPLITMCNVCVCIDLGLQVVESK